MVREIIQTEKGRNRHLNTPISPYLDGYLGDLDRQGFATSTIHYDLCYVTRFGEYLVQHNIEIRDINELEIERFMQWYRSSRQNNEIKHPLSRDYNSTVKSLKGSIRKLLAYLRNIGEISPPSDSVAKIPTQEILDEYLSFLHVHRGLADSTIENHRRWTTAFLVWLDKVQPAIVLSKLTGSNVEHFVAEESNRLKPCACSIMRVTIQAFVNYLKSAGYIPLSCNSFLPKRKRYSLDSLPSAIAWSDIERVLDLVDKTTAMGRRDYAILVLLATYGLRASEVVGLRLEDFDWRQDILSVRQKKSNRTLKLPLVSEVATAIIDYIRNGRPKTTIRHIFITCQAPIKLATRGILYHIVSKALIRAEIKTDHYGPHCLRNTRATSLLRKGNSLKVIGDILGHRHPDSTFLYCKLALEDLRDVALEIPEVQS